jgi:hypothetical protein
MAMNIGISGFITLSILNPATLQPIKSTDPTGGVQRPTLRFNTMIIPKCIGSTPIAETMGRNIGVKIKTAGVISIKTPTNRRIILIIRRIIKGLLVIDNNPLLTFWGIFS